MREARGGRGGGGGGGGGGVRRLTVLALPWQHDGRLPRHRLPYRGQCGSCHLMFSLILQAYITLRASTLLRARGVGRRRPGDDGSFAPEDSAYRLDQLDLLLRSTLRTD